MLRSILFRHLLHSNVCHSECTALRIGHALDKGHLPAALWAQESIVGTMGAGLFSGHSSPGEFQCLCAFASRPVMM